MEALWEVCIVGHSLTHTQYILVEIVINLGYAAVAPSSLPIDNSPSPMGRGCRLSSCHRNRRGTFITQ